MTVQGRIYTISKQGQELDANAKFLSMIQESVDGDVVVIDGRNIAAGSIYASQIHADAITADHIRTDAIMSDHILAGSIDVDRLKGNQLILPGETYGGVTITNDGLSMTSAGLDINLSSSVGFNITDKSGNQLIDINPTTGNVLMQVNEMVIGGHRAATQDDIDGIEVGGRNLLLNSYSLEMTGPDNGNRNVSTFEGGVHIITPTNNGNVYNSRVEPSMELVKGHEYTLSFDVLTNTAIGVYWYANINGTTYSGGRVPDTKGEWIKHEFTYTQARDSFNGKFLFGFSGLIAGSEVKYKNLKLEKGNKATDWTPAPEDTDAKINERPTFDDFVKTDKVTIDGGNITAGTITSQDGYSSINLDNGFFSFGNGRLVWNGSNMTVDGTISVNNIDGDIPKSKLASSVQGEINAGTAAKTKTDAWTHPGTTLIGGDFIQTGTMDANRIRANTITANEIASNAITADKIAANAITIGKMPTADKNIINDASTNASNAINRVGTVEGKIDNAVTTIDNTGVTVKDGSFFLVDGTTDTRYAVPTKENLIKNHSFELVNRDSETGKLYMRGDEWDFIQEDQNESLPGAGFIIEGSEPINIEGLRHVPMNFFGNYSMKVNNKNYLKTNLAIRNNQRYTISAYFRRPPYAEPGGQPRFKLYEVYYSGGGRDIGTFTFDKVESHGNIKRYSKTFQAYATSSMGPEGTSSTYVNTYLEIMSANSDFVQVDGVQLVEGNTPVVYDAEMNHWDFMNGGSSVSSLNVDGSAYFNGPINIPYMITNNLGNTGNFDEADKTSFYQMGASAVGSPSSTWGFLYANTSANENIPKATQISQLFHERDGNQNMYSRAKTNGIWRDWKMISQAEWGSNENGKWVRYSDGTQLAWSTQKVTRTGGWATGTQGTWRAGTPPAQFTDYMAQPSIGEFYNGTGSFNIFWAEVYPINNTAGTIYVTKGLASVTTITVNVFYIGRWKG